ncbi:related to Pheromone alpha factor receptor [Saccharomycodes ludwigii]|uniref:Related to Pheromone alpha factor receptor n=1 Tax=Saccharomycodes ludwigii TaxID=36035 RepID=A0A376B375_9ASCO|nr:hypothetical protein SCDLUD_000670 [Saccharomycodes ludwigii]KAH3903059.1 hypothetical protein SCDLUD_000670 [Saccharomycodes ludwigii]SSD59039.1 related to Pheromone alpha factor receptor [Saccharomycodes ludwigii]
MSNNITIDSNYNPDENYISYTSVYGANTEVPMTALQQFMRIKINQAVVYGTRIGIAGIVMLILFIVTKNKKTPIFIINQISLILTIIHSGLFCRYLLSHYSSIVFNLTLFPQYVPRKDVYLFGATNMIQVLLVASIEFSLVFQINTIFRNVQYKKIGVIISVVSGALGVTTVAMYFITAIKSMINVYASVLQKTDQYYFNVANILLSSSINFMTFLLCVKLVMAIKTRRYLGLRQFDNFHILLIMSSQTLILPSILFILSYALGDVGTTNLVSIAVLFVVISLPLSSMWANVSNTTSDLTYFTANYSPTTSYSQSKSFFSENSSTQESAVDTKSKFKLLNKLKKKTKHTSEVSIDKSIESCFDENETPVNTKSTIFMDKNPSKEELFLEDLELQTATTSGDVSSHFWTTELESSKPDTFEGGSCSQNDNYFLKSSNNVAAYDHHADEMVHSKILMKRNP